MTDRRTLVEKLKDLARDQAGLPEGELAAKLAAKLSKLEDRVPSSTPETAALDLSEVALREFTILVKEKRIPGVWVGQKTRRLLILAAEHVGCLALRLPDRSMVLVGEDRWIEVALYLFSCILREVNLSIDRRYPKRIGRSKTVMAYESGILIGVEAMLRKARQSDESRDRILRYAAARGYAFRRWKLAPVLGEMTSGVGSAEGYRDGRRVSISPGVPEKKG